jgi:GTPase SAR1 family protein
MNPHLIEAALQGPMLRLGEAVRQLHELASETRNQALSSVVSELRTSLSEPFLFVIVGEVKAGKSSFINALLGSERDICKVAPDPCTDTIQQLLYGETEEVVSINPYLRKVFVPAEILRHISIVDTPGTNTIVQHHQEITERFIPRSDLVVFVFEAKNPYRQSAWEFFDYIHADWQKKTLFVLQQADLMTPEDLAVNVQGVRSYAEKKGMAQPRVFPVSAKLEREGHYEQSGFAALNAWLREHVTSRNAWLLKLRSSLATSRNIHQRLEAHLEGMRQQLQADHAFREDIRHSLQDQEERSRQQVEALTAHLISDYERLTQKALRDIDAGLNIFSLARRSVSALFSKGESPQAWLEGLTRSLEKDLNHSFHLNLSEGVEQIAESIGQMARIVDLKIQQSQSALKPQQEIFGQISERRRAVLRELQDSFARFLSETEQFAGREIFPQAAGVAPNLAAGSGLAIIGAVLAAVTQLSALDITGGILSALGLAIAGGTVLLRRGKILQGLGKEIEGGRERIRSEIDQRLKAYVAQIRQRIDRNFEAFDTLLQSESEQVARFSERQAALGDSFGQIEGELAQLP